MQGDQTLLLKRALKGDSAAFEELMEKEEKRMYGVALRFMRNKSDAEDCLQEAMLKVYRSMGTFKGDSSFSTWVYRVTVNVCLDELRRRKSAQETSLDDMEGFDMPDRESDRPESKALEKEFSEAVLNAINELPEDMRTAILLRDMEGYSYDEMSRTMGITLGTVKSRINRSREKLRGILQKKPELFEHLFVKKIKEGCGDE